MTKDDDIVAQEPVVYIRDGQIFTDSQKVADFFEKDHNKVLRDIRTLDITPAFRASNFGHTLISGAFGSVERTITVVEMNFEGFIFLAMGYRGKKAGEIKERYIAAFKWMRDEMDRIKTAPVVQRPAVVQNEIDFTNTLELVELTERLGKFAIEMKARAEVAEAKIQEDAPKVEFAEQFASLDGTYNLRTCASMIGVRDHDFFEHIKKRYIYKDANGNLLPRADCRGRGWFVVKPIATTSRYAHFQTRVTAQGYQRLCREFGKIPDLGTMIPGGTDMRLRLPHVQ